MQHSPAIIAAVFNCVTNKIGARRAHKQLSEEHKTKCPSLQYTEIEANLKRFRKRGAPAPAKGQCWVWSHPTLVFSQTPGP